MKKMLSLVLSILMLVSCCVCITGFTESEIKIMMDGKYIEMDQPPILVNDRTLVPFRAIFEALGAAVAWDDATQTAAGTKDGKEVKITIEQTTAYVDGQATELDVPAMLVNDRTLVPVRFISESLGAKVDWDEANQTVVISTASAQRMLTFDDLTDFVAEKDYQPGGGAGAANISLTAEKDHTSGSGKSVKMTDIKADVYRTKLMNMFTDADLGKTFTVSAYVLSEQSTTVRIGIYSAKGTDHATMPVAEKRATVPANQWTQLSVEYTHSNPIDTMVGICQISSSNFSSTLYIDDVSVAEGGQPSAADAEKEHALLAAGVSHIEDGHRPIPTNFTSGKGYDDLIYYEDELPDNETLYNALPEGTVIIDDSIYNNISEVDNQYGTVEIVDVSGMPFQKAIRATCTSLPPEKPYQFQISFGNFLDGKAEKGDILLLKFYMRTIESQAGETQTGHIVPIIELNTSPNTKVVNTDVFTGKDWEVFYFPFVYDDQYTRGTLRLGYELQTVEIGGYEITNYENTVTLDQLPTNAALPAFLRKEAEWRKEAWDRIEQIRRGDIRVIVQDANGNAIPNADVRVDMYETDFEWGTAIGSGVLTNANYQKTLSENFNAVVNENDLKWNYYLKDPTAAKKQFEVCNLLGIKHFRGHCLMWDKATVNNGINSAFPDDLPNYFDDYEKMQSIICGHISEIMPEFKDTIGDWDVLNEAMRKDMRIIPKYGFPMIKEWYDAARATNSGAELYYNDYKTQGEMVNFVKSLIEAGVDFDGVGLQSHHDSAPDIVTTLKWWNEIAEMGKRLKITEYDFATMQNDQELQASYTRDYMIAAFSVEAMDGFYIWGHYGGANNARVLYTGDFTPRLTLEVWQDLIYNKWWTNEAGLTNADGEYAVKGYYGDYDITVSANGKEKTVEAHCHKGQDNTIVITLD